MDFDIRIAAWRSWLGDNQTEFAARCGVTQQTVSAWEHGLNAPSLCETWRIVTKVVGVTWARFWSYIPKARKSSKASARAQAAA